MVPAGRFVTPFIIAATAIAALVGAAPTAIVLASGAGTLTVGSGSGTMQLARLISAASKWPYGN